jgi:hypothetical protein
VVENGLRRPDAERNVEENGRGGGSAPESPHLVHELADSLVTRPG